jgi:hypothetical protein
MNFSARFVLTVLILNLPLSMVIAVSTPAQQDMKAVEILNNMSTYLASMDRLEITGQAQLTYVDLIIKPL